MKKLSIVGFNAILVAIISFSGCELVENSSQIPQTNEAKIKAAKNELAIPAETVSDIDLPTVLKGVAISWASSDEAVISSAGLVTRQPYDTAATLTATLALGNASDTREFEVTVPADVIEIVFEEVEAELVELYYWVPSGNHYYTKGQNNQIIMKYADENAVFDCTVDYGLFRKSSSSFIATEKNASANSGGIVYWDTGGEGFSSKTYGFIDVIARSGEAFIGYAVIEVFERNDGFEYDTHGAIVLKSALFPQVGGERQSVSEDYVRAAIEKIKAEAVEMNANPPIEVEAELVELENIMGSSSVRPVMITIIHPDENVVFDCTVDNGNFLYWEYVKNVSARSGDGLLWMDRGPDFDVNHAIIEIILKLDAQIVGYVVIEVYPARSNLLKSVLFPQVNGEYQDISEEYLKKAIKKAIDLTCYLN